MAPKHNVRQGDTLYSLAKANHTSVSDILAVNPSLGSQSLIRVGDALTLPSAPFAVPVRPRTASRGTMRLSTNYGVFREGALEAWIGVNIYCKRFS